MSYTVGDGSVAVAIAAGIIGYIYIRHQSRNKRLEIIHQERLVAMEKGIPLPEFPPDPSEKPPDQTVVPILGIVLLSFSLGAMIVLFRALQPAAHSFWVAPMPVAFMGVGLLAFHFLKRDDSR